MLNRLYFYIGKLALKWAKKSHFCLKNASIDPKIGHIMYLDSFNKPQKFHRKILKIDDFLDEKPHFLPISAKKIRKSNFTKNVSSPSILIEIA